MTKISAPEGFTLIETLVAIAIISVAVVGPLITASRALAAAYAARDQLTASYLAQEGVEYVRLMRDSVYLADYAANPADPTLSTDAFDDFTGGTKAGSVTLCVGTGEGTTQCTLNDALGTMGVGTGKALSLCGASCPALYLNGGRFTTGTGGTPTPFTRTITFYGGPSGALGSELEVVVTVSWKEKLSSYTTSITEYLSPWQ